MKTMIIAKVAKVPGLRSVARALSDRRGVTALEYGLVAALIAAVVIAAVPQLQDGFNAAFTNIGTSFQGKSTFK